MNKKIIYSLFSCVFIACLVMFCTAKHVKNKLDTVILANKSLQGENVVSIVDTIYGRKYIIDVDTVTGVAKIVGVRHNPVKIEISLP